VLPPLPLEQLVGELRRVRAAVSVDSGLGQLAAALGVPTVALYGPTDPALTGCVGARAANVAASFPCAPCRKRACGYRGAAVLDCGRPVEPACFASVTVDGVFARLERVL
jgi:heptosyltransferase-1